MSAPLEWKSEENLSKERKMEILVKEIMSIQSSIESYCDLDEGKHAIAHCENALELATNIQDCFLNTVPSQPPLLTTYYFTFTLGDAQHCNHFVKITAKDYFVARNKMVKYFGSRWAFQYSEHDWFGIDGVSQAEKFGYSEWKLPDE